MDHSMKDKNQHTMTESDGQTAAAVQEPPLESKREWRLPCNSLDKELAEQLVARAREDGVGDALAVLAHPGPDRPSRRADPRRLAHHR